jgi:hypothetical protein
MIFIACFSGSEAINMGIKPYSTKPEWRFNPHWDLIQGRTGNNFLGRMPKSLGFICFQQFSLFLYTAIRHPYIPFLWPGSGSEQDNFVVLKPGKILIPNTF